MIEFIKCPMIQLLLVRKAQSNIPSRTRVLGIISMANICALVFKIKWEMLFKTM